MSLFFYDQAQNIAPLSPHMTYPRYYVRCELIKQVVTLLSFIGQLRYDNDEPIIVHSRAKSLLQLMFIIGFIVITWSIYNCSMATFCWVMQTHLF